MSRMKKPTKVQLEKQLQEANLLVDLNRLAVNYLGRWEVCWTKRYKDSQGFWVKMGYCGAAEAHGGVVLIRDFCPINKAPYQRAVWAGDFIHDMKAHHASWGPSDERSRCYRDCLLDLAARYEEAQKNPQPQTQE
jgi:hypothetical protein